MLNKELLLCKKGTTKVVTHVITVQKTADKLIGYRMDAFGVAGAGSISPTTFNSYEIYGLTSDNLDTQFSVYNGSFDFTIPGVNSIKLTRFDINKSVILDKRDADGLGWTFNYISDIIFFTSSDIGKKIDLEIKVL